MPEAAMVEQIHHSLVRLFANEEDPISPSGVKSQDLLESACARPHIGLGSSEKYRTVYEKAAALLHDIGLSKEPSRQHAAIGASLVEAFPHQQGYFTPDQIVRIGDAIRHHSSLTETGLLFHILQDADGLEVLGAVGLLRAMSSKWQWENYHPEHIRGVTWGMHADDFTARFASWVGIGNTIVDQINVQISCYKELTYEHRQTDCDADGWVYAWVYGTIRVGIRQGQGGSV